MKLRQIRRYKAQRVARCYLFTFNRFPSGFCYFLVDRAVRRRAMARMAAWKATLKTEDGRADQA